MDDEMSDGIDDQAQPGDAEVERRLSAFANARLSPTLDAEARIRATVMARVAAPSGPTAGPAATTRRWRAPRPIALLLAACLTLAVIVGGALAARPGGPLYATSVSIEAANLPTQLAQRAQAEVDRLERRIAEARSAVAGRDAGAAEAALTAYSSIVTVAGTESGGDASAVATLASTLTRHVGILEGLVGTVPAPAADAATQALQSCNMTLDGLDQP